MLNTACAGTRRTPCVGALSARASRLRHVPARRLCAVATCAKKGTDRGNGDKHERGTLEDRVRKAVDGFKRDGIDAASAKKLLKQWQEDDGVNDGESLRKKVNDTGKYAMGRLVLQLGWDLVATVVSFQTPEHLDLHISAQGLNVEGGLVVAFYALSCYYAYNAALDVMRIRGVIAGTVATGARTDELYAALQQLAAGRSGIVLLDSAEVAVNTAKVILALNSVRIALQDGEAEGGWQAKSTLRRLQSHCLLEHAQATFGWNAEAAGMALDDALMAAATFAQFDKNGDNRLEVAELNALCQGAQFTLTDAEATRAVELLGNRRSGFVEFDEFAAWWAAKAGASNADIDRPVSNA